MPDLGFVQCKIDRRFCVAWRKGMRRYMVATFVTISSMPSTQRVSCLCLLSMALHSPYCADVPLRNYSLTHSLPSWPVCCFDTIDHNTLLSRLSSWFGIHGIVLNSFKSYLSSRSFRVACSGSLSSPHDSLYGVPQGFVLGPLLFILYTTPHSLDHHLYTDDTQIFLFFRPPDF